MFFMVYSLIKGPLGLSGFLGASLDFLGASNCFVGLILRVTAACKFYRVCYTYLFRVLQRFYMLV